MRGAHTPFDLSSAALCFGRVWLMLGILIGGSLQSRGEDAASFTVTGDISVSIMMESRVVTNMTYPFSVAVFPTGWNIKTRFENGNHIEAGCDDTNVYSILSSEKADLGFVSEGTYPLNEGWFITLPWLAYCSSNYVDSTNFLPAPWLNAHDIPMASIFRMSGQKLEMNPRLPKSIIFRVTGKKTADDIKNRGWLASANFTEENLKPLEIFQEGFLGAEYTVNGTTNIAGLTVPVDFKLISHPVPPDTVTTIYHGHITSAFRTGATDPLPKIKRQMPVTDYRFRNSDAKVDFINYAIHSGQRWIFDKSSPALQARFHKAVER